MNGDGRLQLRELAELLNVEKNFLDICPKSLQQKDLGQIFKHYDHDESGVVEGPEFLAFVRDVLRIDQQPLSKLKLVVPSSKIFHSLVPMNDITCGGPTEGVSKK